MMPDCKQCRYAAACLPVGPTGMLANFIDSQARREMIRLGRTKTYTYDVMQAMTNMVRSTITGAWQIRLLEYQLPEGCVLREFAEAKDAQD